MYYISIISVDSSNKQSKAQEHRYASLSNMLLWYPSNHQSLILSSRFPFNSAVPALFKVSHPALTKVTSMKGS